MSRDARAVSQARLGELTAAAWALAAAGAWVEGGVPAELEAPVLEVLAAAGLDAGALPQAEVRNTLLQIGDLVERSRAGTLAAGWTHTDPLLLQAQGDTSAAGVDALVGMVFPMVGREVESFLDVGTGVGSVSIELCRRVPQLRVVALEPQQAPLELARRNVAAAGLEDRIELRAQLVEDLPDEHAFDVAWLPSTFMPRAVVARALAVLHRALRPGGAVLTATLGGGEGLPAAAARLRAVLWGGEVVEPSEIEAMAREAGYAETIRGPSQGTLVPLLIRR